MKSTKKQFDLICVGGSTVDICFYSKEGELIPAGGNVKQKMLAFEYGAKIVADRVYTTCGGGAANSAVSAARLGLKSAIISRIGDDSNGQIITKNLKDNKVSTELIKLDPQASSGFSVILTIDNPSKEHIAFIHRGANSKLSAKDFSSAISTDWFYATSLPSESWKEIMSKLVKTGKNIVWNPGNEQLKDIPALKKFLPRIKLLMVNHLEAMEFRKLKDIKGLLTHLHGLGPKLAVITDGASGAYAFDGKKYYFMKAKSNKTVNTLGVGDAFGSALTSALIYDKNIKEALSWGIKNSASVVGEIGAQAGLLTKKEIEK
ncbi:MAG: carbohydrate kinase family protein [Candidatus Buchananbacteria bacterium]